MSRTVMPRSVEALEDAHDPMLVRVEVTGGLVGQDDRRPLMSARDRDALLPPPDNWFGMW
jgi:hypothetical protein